MAERVSDADHAVPPPAGQRSSLPPRPSSGAAGPAQDDDLISLIDEPGGSLSGTARERGAPGTTQVGSTDPEVGPHGFGRPQAVSGRAASAVSTDGIAARPRPAGGTSGATPARRPAPPSWPLRGERRLLPVAAGWLCLLVAAGWGWGADALNSELSVRILMRYLNAAAQMIDADAPPRSPQEAGESAGPVRSNRLNIFPPVGPPVQRPTPSLQLRPSPPPGTAAPSTPTPMHVVADAGAGGAHPPRGPLDAQREFERVIWADCTRTGWTAVTYLLIGVIAMAGIMLTVTGAGPRLAVFGLISMVLGATIAGLTLFLLHRSPLRDRAWIDWAFDLTQGRHAWAWHVCLATAAAFVAGLWALRPDASPRRWILVAAGAMIVATFASLLGVSLLETYSRFPPLRGWQYAVLSVGQSFVAWVLLLMSGRVPEARTA